MHQPHRSAEHRRAVDQADIQIALAIRLVGGDLLPQLVDIGHQRGVLRAALLLQPGFEPGFLGAFDIDRAGTAQAFELAPEILQIVVEAGDHAGVFHGDLGIGLAGSVDDV